MELGKKNKILIVDDQALIRNSLKNLISILIRELDLNYEIIEGSDGIDIINYLTDDYTVDSIKLVFTDEDMEIVNGSTAILAIRQLESEFNYKTKTIISVTSSADNVLNRERILNSGADLVLSKPPRKTELKALMRRVLIK